MIEADSVDFREYGKQVVKNAKVLASELQVFGFSLVAGGTESHLMVIDLTALGLSGNVVAEALEAAGLVANRNTVPGDISPFYPSGVRLGTPAVTTRGMKEAEMKRIASLVMAVVDHVKGEKLPESKDERILFMRSLRKRLEKDTFLKDIAGEVKTLCQNFPCP